MIKGTLRALLVGGIIMMGIAASGFAQDADELEFTFGSVVAITANEVVILEYDFVSEKEIEITYKIGPEAVSEGIIVGDNVDIEFVQVNSEKILKGIYKVEADDDPGFEEESVDLSENIQGDY